MEKYIWSPSITHHIGSESGCPDCEFVYRGHWIDFYEEHVKFIMINVIIHKLLTLI